MLQIDGLAAGYLGAPVVQGITLSISRGELFCLLGANGAGKSTIARAAAGLLAARAGSITVDGRDVTSAKAHKRMRAGLSLVPEARHLFTSLSVRDNILLGAYTVPKAERTARLERVVALFPQLSGLMANRARDLSGGEQQMLAIGRALMSDPKYLILDEPSLGLAPIFVDAILARARELADGGAGILLIEQNVDKALALSDRAAVVESGRITLAGPSSDVRDNPAVVASYLGGA